MPIHDYCPYIHNKKQYVHSDIDVIIKCSLNSYLLSHSIYERGDKTYIGANCGEIIL